MELSGKSDEVLSKLVSRLPELEWKITGLGTHFSSHRLPKGLFRAGIDSHAADYITEIKEDIRALAQQQNERSSLYLAERIRQKINVLVVLCRIHHQKNKSEEKVYFGLKMLSTRQQWIHDIESEIATLTRQQQAMSETLAELRHHRSDAVLQLNAELGEVERRLTLAREALKRAVS